MTSAPAPASRLPQSSLDHADALRGISALLVLAGHVRGFAFVDWRDVHGAGISMRALYAATGVGHQCVIVFFVLSGFFIGNSVLTARATETFSWRGFLLNRFTRLYVVLIPALLVTAAIDAGGMHAFGASHNTYSGDLDAEFMTRIDVRQTLNLGTFLGNAAYLQSFLCKPFGSNGPLWSLSYEFWCYIVFPLAAQALARGTRWWARTIAVAIISVVFAVGGLSMVLYFGIWLVGAGVAALRAHPVRGSIRHLVRWTSRLAFPLCLAAARAHLAGPEAAGDVLLGVATGAFLLTLLWDGHATGGGWYGRAAKALAGFSYTLYLVHMPLVVLLNVAFVGTHRWQPDALHLAYAALAFVGIVALFVYPLSLATEAHTARVRTWLGARLGIASSGG